MTDLDPWLDAFRAHTEPDAAQIHRLTHGVGRASWRIAPLVLVAAAVVVVVVVVQWPAAPPTPVQQPLSDSFDHALSPHVQVVGQGQGQVDGTTDALTVDWVAGALTVAVTPDQGVDLEVRTPEAVVAVRGTQFQVRRDALGTEVRVSRGVVDLTCVDAPTRALLAGEQHLCPPTTAVGWLRRVTVHQQERAFADVIDGVTEALLLHPVPPLELELRLHRAAAHVAQGRPDLAEADLRVLEQQFPDAQGRIDAVRTPEIP